MPSSPVNPARVQKLKGILKEASKTKDYSADVRQLLAAAELAGQVGSDRIPLKYVRQMVSEFVGALKDTKDAFGRQIDDLKKAVRAYVDKVEARLAGKVEAVDRRVSGLDIDGRISRALAPVTRSVADVRRAIPSLDEVEGSVRSIDHRVTALERKPAPVIPKPTDVSDLVRRIKELESREPVVRNFFGGGRPVHVPMVDKFTGDGSTKGFFLTKAPRDLATVKAWGSDFPHIMTHGATNGFTISGKELTLNGDIDAPTVGAYLVVEYYV